MENLIDSYTEMLYSFEKRRNSFFNERIGNSRTNMICFLLICLLPVAVFLSFFSGIIVDSFIYSFSGFIIYMFFALVALIHTAAIADLKSKKGYTSLFEVPKSVLKRINFGFLELSRKEIIQFRKLMRDREVTEKINFKFIAKSKKPNYKKLFSVLHVVTEGKIINMYDSNRQLLFKVIESSFLMNGQAVNEETLHSSYSNWNLDLTSKDATNNTKVQLSFIREQLLKTNKE